MGKPGPLQGRFKYIFARKTVLKKSQICPIWDRSDTTWVQTWDHSAPQADSPVASLYIESGIWGAMWHRIAQSMQVLNPATDMPLHDMETRVSEEAMRASAKFSPPDWALVSPQGLMASLQMAVAVFTKVWKYYLFDLIWLKFDLNSYFLFYLMMGISLLLLFNLDF